jgi:hypothetical protein
MVEGFDLNIWNNSWIKRKDLNDILAQNKIFNEGIINELDQIIQYDEFKLFEYENDPTAS